jgi:hypothetical protein
MNMKENKTVECEPIYDSLFEAIFLVGGIQQEDDQILTNQLISINRHEIKFNLNFVDGKIQPLERLYELKNSRFDITVKMHDRSGKVLGELTYENVTVEGDNFADNTFDYDSGETFKLIVKISAARITYTGVNQIDNEIYNSQDTINSL